MMKTGIRLVQVLAGALLFIGCASSPRAESRDRGIPVLVVNESIETLRITMDGRRVASLGPRERACVFVPHLDVELAYTAVGSTAPPVVVRRPHGSSGGWLWKILGQPSDIVGMEPAGMCQPSRR